MRVGMNMKSNSIFNTGTATPKGWIILKITMPEVLSYESRIGNSYWYQIQQELIRHAPTGHLVTVWGRANKYAETRQQNKETLLMSTKNNQNQNWFQMAGWKAIPHTIERKAYRSAYWTQEL